jgi:hypothetical protein
MLKTMGGFRMEHIPTTRSTRGLEPIGGTPERFGDHIRREIAKYADIVRVANMKID